MTKTNQTLAGKISMVTGATSGIGRVTARALAERGATVVIVGRNPDKSAATVAQIKEQTGNPAVEAMLADLSSLSDVRRLAEEFQARYSRLHILVNNAGAIFLSRKKSVDGFELTFALNHLNYFLLTNLLLDTLKASAPSRIVNVSSAMHSGASMDFDDLHAERKYSGMSIYGRSKLANLLFTYELARRLEGMDISVNALHPGMVATNFAANNGVVGRLVRPAMNLFSISEEEGADTLIYLATAPEVEGISGKYFIKRRAVPSSPDSYDPVSARRLWRISEELVGLPVTA